MDEVLGRPLFVKKGDPQGQMGFRRVEAILYVHETEIGTWEFLTHWANTPSTDDSWEPSASFLHGCSQHWLEICWNNHIDVSLMEA